MSVGHTPSLSLSSFFYHRELNGNAMMGTIPSEIATLTKLTHLYAPSLIKVIECWSCFLLSVGHVRLLSAFQKVVFLFTGSSRSTDWLGQYQLKYLHWLSCHNCESSLLFYLVLIRASQHFSFNE